MKEKLVVKLPATKRALTRIQTQKKKKSSAERVRKYRE